MALINAREELAHAPIGAFHYKFAVLVAFVMFFDGYDLFNAAYVIPLVRQSWHPSATLIGVMLSSGIAGLSIGSVLQGVLADRFGRRKIMILALWLLTISSILLATLVHGAVEFAFGRLILGTALGMVTPLALTCINEWAPRKQANTYATWVFQFGFSAGGIFAGIAGIMLTHRFGWQSFYYIGALSAVVAVAAMVWLPESIQYLLLHNRAEEVRSWLSIARPERRTLYANADFGALSPITRIGSVVDLLSPLYRRNTIVHWIVGFLSLFCIHGLTGWLPSLVIASGAGVNSAFAYGTLTMIASVFGGIAMGWLADRLRSRIHAMIIGYALAALSMTGLGFAIGHAFVLPMVAATGFFIFGAQAVLNNYQAMSYRTEVRGTGMGVAVGLNRVGGILGPVIVGAIAAVDASAWLTFAVFACALLLAAVIISLGKIELASLPSDQMAAAAEAMTSPDATPRVERHDPAHGWRARH